MHQWDTFAAARRHSAATQVGAFVQELVADGVVRESDRVASITAAAVWLGPTTAPPESLRDTVVAAARATEARQENPLNVAVALGCGWNRPGDDTAWGRTWGRAVVAMTDEFRRAVGSANRLLGSLVDGYAMSLDEHDEYSDVLAVSFVRGCRCGRHHRGCAGPGAHECCIGAHSLHNWDPSVAHLSAYVDQAVRGLAGPTIKGAAFADGMLYRELQRGSRLRRAAVEGYECHDCGTVREDGTCPQHGATAARPGTRRVAMVNRLVVPATAGGRYVARNRNVCGSPGCETLYVVAPDRSCPRCSWQPTEGARPRRKQVWVRTQANGRRDSGRGDLGAR